MASIREVWSSLSSLGGQFTNFHHFVLQPQSMLPNRGRITPITPTFRPPDCRPAQTTAQPLGTRRRTRQTGTRVPYQVLRPMSEKRKITREIQVCTEG